jgi:pyruvate formate lyase activating enzyme
MKFCGIQKTSLIDFPNRVASVLFTPGCNLRCPYCQNWRIVLNPKPPYLKEETALKILEGRKKYVDAVVITGGEPTFQRDLPKFLRKLKGIGFAIKLDTNGFYPQVLSKSMPYLDYVALDVKTSLEKYRRLGTKNVAPLQRAIDILKTGKVDYEFRTTVVPGLVDLQDIAAIGRMIKGARRYVLQQFDPTDTLDRTFRNVKPYSAKVIAEFAGSVKHVNNVTVRI